MIYLAFVTHDTQSNTLEAVFCKKTDIEVKRISCTNYSPDQKDQFITDIGVDSAKYITMAGW